MPSSLASTGPVLIYVHIAGVVGAGRTTQPPPTPTPRIPPTPRNPQDISPVSPGEPLQLDIRPGASMQPAAPPAMGRVLAAAGGRRPPPFVPTEQPVFLGTCERFPRVSMHSYFHEVPRDDLGSRAVWDLMYDSEEAYVFAELNYFDERVLEAVQDRLYRSTFPSPTRGYSDSDAVGTLLRLEQRAFALTLSLPYSRKTLFGANGMPATFTFPNAVCWGPDEWTIGSQQPRKIRLVWRCIRSIDENFEREADGTGVSQLYYHDPDLRLPAAI